MESFYWTVFAFFLVATGFLEMKNRAAAAAAEKGQERGSALFNAFKNNYLLVYSLMMGTRAPPYCEMMETRERWKLAALPRGGLHIQLVIIVIGG
jgi:hypothetical protein